MFFHFHWQTNHLWNRNFRWQVRMLRCLDPLRRKWTLVFGWCNWFFDTKWFFMNNWCMWFFMNYWCWWWWMDDNRFWLWEMWAKILGETFKAGLFSLIPWKICFGLILAPLRSYWAINREISWVTSVDIAALIHFLYVLSWNCLTQDFALPKTTLFAGFSIKLEIFNLFIAIISDLIFTLTLHVPDSFNVSHLATCYKTSPHLGTTLISVFLKAVDWAIKNVIWILCWTD